MPAFERSILGRAMSTFPVPPRALAQEVAEAGVVGGDEGQLGQRPSWRPGPERPAAARWRSAAMRASASGLRGGSARRPSAAAEAVLQRASAASAAVGIEDEGRPQLVRRRVRSVPPPGACGPARRARARARVARPGARPVAARGMAERPSERRSAPCIRQSSRPASSNDG